MKSSSATQLQFDSDSVSLPEASIPAAIRIVNESVNTVESRLPSLSFSKEAYATTARRAGRLNAASISKEEQEKLLAERKALLEKKYTGQISRREINRLELVRWALDRIDDARYGQALEALAGC